MVYQRILGSISGFPILAAARIVCNMLMILVAWTASKRSLEVIGHQQVFYCKGACSFFRRACLYACVRVLDIRRRTLRLVGHPVLEHFATGV